MTRSIFISYSSKDVKIAETIENHLLKNGFNDVWRDKSKIRSDWSKEIANALSEKDVILLIWSENSSKSEWVKNEWLTARAIGKPIRLIIFSALDKIPKPLANLESIVLENDDIIISSSNSMQKIVNKLKEREQSLYQEYNFNTLPSKRHIPYDLNPDFTGRDTDIVELYLELIADLNKLAYKKIGIVGIGGVGKTQLAVEFFYRYAFAFEKGIFWIDGTDPSRWLDQMVAIARDRLDLEISQEQITETERNKRYFIEFQKYCSENGSKMLLLVDNVIDPLDLNKDNILFPGDPMAKFILLTLGCNLLFTTRRDIKNKLPNVIEHQLGMLLPKSAYDLLTKYRKPPSKEEQEYAYRISSFVGYLPLAVVLAQARLTKFKEKITFEKYYNAMKQKSGLEIIDWNKISELELGTRHKAAVRATFEPDWDSLSYKDDDDISFQSINVDKKDIQNSRILISILSLLPESAIIPKNRLVLYSGIENKDEFDLLEFPAESAFNLLDELNLIDILEEGKSVRIHPLLREFVYEKVQKEKNVENLMLESIINVKKRYYDDFSILVDEYTNEKDIDSILDDFKTVLEWSPNEQLKLTKEDGYDEIITDSIYSLYKILEQESHNLLLKERNSFVSPLSPTIVDRSLVFAQQIHIRATDLAQDDIIQKSRAYLQQTKNRPFLDILWARVKDKSALIRTLEGHSSYVNSIAVTPDGTKIVSGSWDKTIKVWDMASGRLLNTLAGHSSYVTSVAVTPDGTKIVSGARDNTIKVWDMASGRLLNTLAGHSDIVAWVAVTPDGTKIVSGSGDNTIKVWDLNSGSAFTCKFDASISAIAVSKNLPILVIGDSTGGVYAISTYFG